MISILIPTYQYSVQELVQVIHREAENLKIPYEIIILDDASPIEVEAHKSLNDLANVSYKRLSENIGRTAARQHLAIEATYNNLLFMDADVLPVQAPFLATYSEEIDRAELIFGGISYRSETPETQFTLRWKYGKAREVQSFSERSNHPYSSINSGCFMIKKERFISINSELQQQRYGMDLLFKQLLKEQNVSVKHIENPVYHLGLESNEVFLKKSLRAINTTVDLENSGLLKTNGRPLQQKYIQLRKLGLLRPFRFVVNMMNKTFERNFDSQNPNLFWFDLYRLSYYSKLKKKNA